jgi:N-acetylglucosamine repressor
VIIPELALTQKAVERQNNFFFLYSYQQALNKYCLDQIVANTKIVISDIWEQSGLLGITAMLFQKLFSDMYK